MCKNMFAIFVFLVLHLSAQTAKNYAYNLKTKELSNPSYFISQPWTICLAYIYIYICIYIYIFHTKCHEWNDNTDHVVERPTVDLTGANKVNSLKSMCMSFISNRVKFCLTQKMRDELGSNSVVNLSDFVLEPRHISLLSKGLTFCPSPGEEIWMISTGKWN